MVYFDIKRFGSTSFAASDGCFLGRLPKVSLVLSICELSRRPSDKAPAHIDEARLIVGIKFRFGPGLPCPKRAISMAQTAAPNPVPRTVTRSSLLAWILLGSCSDPARKPDNEHLLDAKNGRLIATPLCPRQIAARTWRN
jgi:hypothetical protein